MASPSAMGVHGNVDSAIDQPGVLPGLQHARPARLDRHRSVRRHEHAIFRGVLLAATLIVRHGPVYACPTGHATRRSPVPRAVVPDRCETRRHAERGREQEAIEAGRGERFFRAFGAAPVVSRLRRTHLRRELALYATKLDRYRLTLVAAPGGSGKTTLVARWRHRLAERGRPVAWLGLTDLHRDPTILLEDLLGALRVLAPDDRSATAGFGESIERLLSERHELRPERAARALARELSALETPPLVCLDAFEHLEHAGPSFAIVDRWLRIGESPLHLVVTTRGLRPDASTLLLASGEAQEITAADLSLRSEQVAAVLRDEHVEPDESLVAPLLARTQGWAMAVRLAARSLAHVPTTERDRFVRAMDGHEDLIGYVGAEILGRASPEATTMVERAALLGRTSRSLLRAAAEDEAGDEAIDEAIHAGLLTVEGNDLTLHDLLRQWLGDRVRRDRGEAEWARLHEQIARALEESDEGERAVAHYVRSLSRSGVRDQLVALLCREGDVWFARGHRRVVQQALDALGPSHTDEIPELIALRGMLLSTRDPDQAIQHLKTASDAYQRAGRRRAELLCLLEIAVVATNENRPEETRAIYRRALSLRRIATDVSARALVSAALSAGAFMAGRHALAIRLVDVALTYDHDPRERSLLGVVQAWSLFYQGRWTELERRMERHFAHPRQRQYALGFHAIQIVLAAVEAGRGGDLAAVRERLETARDAFDEAPYTMNRIRVEQALALRCREEGDPDRARQHLASGIALARRIELYEAEASCLGLLARIDQAAGDPASARKSAEQALDLLERPAAWSRRWGTSFFWVVGVASAGTVLAELGEAPAAVAFVTRHRRRMLHAELPLTHHAVSLCLARIFDAAGDDARAKAALDGALRAAREGRLEGLAPELDEALLGWAERQAASRGLTLLGAAGARAPSKTPPPELELRTLGGMALLRKGRPVPDRHWRGAVPKRLLGRLLVAEGRALTRERIEADLWPDATARSARNNLSVALNRLRNVLEPRRRREASTSLLDVDGERLALRSELLACWDVTRLRDALARAERATDEGHASEVVEAARLARALAAEDFLPESYDDWTSEFRGGLDRSIVDQAHGLAEIWLERGDPHAAEELARLGLARLSTHELSWAVLVRARLRLGDRSGARRTLEEARGRLRQELDLEPGEALRALAETLAEGHPGATETRA